MPEETAGKHREEVPEEPPEELYLASSRLEDRRGSRNALRGHYFLPQ